MRRIHVVGIELSMAGESQDETKLELLRYWLFGDVGADNAGIRAGHRFREITDAARELTKGRLGYAGLQPHQHHVHEH